MEWIECHGGDHSKQSIFFTSIPHEKGILMEIVASTFTDCGLLHTYSRHKWDASMKSKRHSPAVIYPVPFPKVIMRFTSRSVTCGRLQVSKSLSCWTLIPWTLKCNDCRLFMFGVFSFIHFCCPVLKTSTPKVPITYMSHCHISNTFYCHAPLLESLLCFVRSRVRKGCLELWLTGAYETRIPALLAGNPPFTGDFSISRPPSFPIQLSIYREFPASDVWYPEGKSRFRALSVDQSTRNIHPKTKPLNFVSGNRCRDSQIPFPMYYTYVYVYT